MNAISKHRAPFFIAAVTTALGVLLGAAGGKAWACDKRGPNLRENWELELVTAELEGEPRIAPILVVGSEAELYRHGKKRNEVVLTNPSRRFEKVSE
ncbi:MAG: hypothetical protein NXI35_13045 [bacterium]|nr:hypothetical protein [bacterium]